jgi:large subunit ribosomal protein L19e
MVDVSNQRRMAAQIMKCGLYRVYMPPDKEKLQEISEATTRAAVRSLIVRRYITKVPERGVSRGRARLYHEQRRKGRRRGMGSRRGPSGARTNDKTRWISNIRAMRLTLRRLRVQKKISTKQYRAYYMMAKGGQFHSSGHLLLQMETRGDLKPLGGKPRAAPAPVAAPKGEKVRPKKVERAPAPAEKKGGVLKRRKGAKEE